MNTAFMVLIPLALLGVVGALVFGLRHFLQEGEAARERSNRMMRLRILFQFVAVVLLALAFAFGAGGGR